MKNVAILKQTQRPAMGYLKFWLLFNSSFGSYVNSAPGSLAVGHSATIKVVEYMKCLM